MNLETLIQRLLDLRKSETVTDDSPVIVEGNMNDDLLQLAIEEVFVERRCEDDDEPSAVYIRFSDVED